MKNVLVAQKSLIKILFGDDLLFTLIDITKTNGPFCSEVLLSNFLASWSMLVVFFLDAKDKVNYLEIHKEFYCWEELL